MRYLFNAWSEIEPLLTRGPVIVFLDYDGTLTPIVERPELANLSNVRRELLAAAAQTPGIYLVIVSGRALLDVKEKVSLEGICYAGNHGLEFEDAAGFHVHPQAIGWQRMLSDLAERLTKSLSEFDGLFVENKIFTLSVHYRQVDPELQEMARRVLLHVLQTDYEFSKLVLTEGKMVWEIRPPVLWNKGTVLLWLQNLIASRRDQIPCPVYAGDDQTDEDAFKVVKQLGMGIKITRDPNEPSDAAYYLYSPAELFNFLEMLIKLKKTREDSAHVEC